jgi:hypothetical protein
MSDHGYNTCKRRTSNQSSYSNGDNQDGSIGSRSSSTSSRRGSNDSHSSSASSNTSSNNSSSSKTSSAGSAHSYNTRRRSCNGTNGKSNGSNGSSTNGRAEEQQVVKSPEKPKKGKRKPAANGAKKTSNGRKLSTGEAKETPFSMKNGCEAEQSRDAFGRPNRSAARSSLSEKRERVEGQRRELSRRRSEQVQKLWEKAEAALRSPSKEGDFSPLLGDGRYFTGAGAERKDKGGHQADASKSLEEVIALAAESEASWCTRWRTGASWSGRPWTPGSRRRRTEGCPGRAGGGPGRAWTRCF